MRVDPQLLKSLKVAQLKELLAAIGSRTTGTKDQLTTRLESDLHRPKLAKLAQYRNPEPTRIVSIDMGIKNLGLCVADVSFAKSDGGAGSGTTARMRVDRWQRLNLVDGANGPGAGADDAEGADSAGGFSPAALSAVAVRLVRDELLPHRPAAVLVERQRWRSGGRAAVAEWTLRVNALEAMLWAVFRALGPSPQACVDGQRRAGPELHAVSPARVAAFWLPGLRRVEKKAKVDLVRASVARRALGAVEIGFGEDAAEVAQGFGAAGSRTRRRDVDGAVTGRKKLDDLADSFLQAGAWAAWEANRRGLLEEGAEKFMRGRESAHVRDE
jgi:cruciform cutting endonuclease 1